MKKLLLVIILLVSPLMAQEKKDLYIETGIFTRIEGVSSLLTMEAPTTPVSLTALEFSIGKDNIYLYTQFRFSTALPYWDTLYLTIPRPYDTTGKSVLYGRRLGFLVGIGGKIYDSHPNNISKKFTMHMNFAIGGDFTIDKSIQDIVLNPLIYEDMVSFFLHHYYTIELNWMMKYYFQKDFGMQFGFNLAISGTGNVDKESTIENPKNPHRKIYSSEMMMRYGFSFGFVF